MAPLNQSEFWHDPSLNITDPRRLVQKAKECSLVLDIDTSKVFDEVDIETLTMDAAKERLLSALSEQMGALTLEFDPSREDVVKVPINKGQFVIFTERTMHGSPANISSRRRLAINGRITRADTIVYPGRLRGNFIDGSNLDIRKHRCVLLSGQNHQKNNVTADAKCY
jgi:non-heme Fe2+,alpha-ketoglutarate-dependent halogenase